MSNTIKQNSKAIRITATTVSPLLQTGEAGGQRTRFVYEDGERGRIPFFSANGLRGSLRRMATRQQLSSCDCKDKIIPEIFYLYTSGAGLSRISIGDIVTPENEMDVRENAPILSVFGAGLSAIEGKVAVADFTPSPDQERWGVSDNGSRYSLLMGKETNFRTDSIRDAELWNEVLNVEQIKKWRDDYAEMVADSKKSKATAKASGDNDAKEENSHIQQPVTSDFILPGVKLTSSIKAKYGHDISDVEMGMIISALIELSQTQIGSSARIGWGVLDWTVEYDGQLLFKTEANPEYILDKKVITTKKGEELVDAWKAWLEAHADNMLELQE